VRELLAILLGGLLLCATGIQAEEESPAAGVQGTQQPSMKIYRYRDRFGATSFSDRAPSGIRYEIVQLNYCYACNPRSSVDWYSTPLQLEAFRDPIVAAAREYGVDPALVRAVIHAESAFRPGARSKKGAMGLMQLMPDTARDMGVSDAFSPRENIRGGVKYLAWLLEKNGGSTTLATAAYNAGPGAVERHQGIPPYEETQTYVKRVRILYDRYRKALADAWSHQHVSQING